MAISFPTSSVSSPETSLHTIEKFNGVDYTTTPTLVDDSRAIDISNYLPNGDSLIKRHGVSTVCKLMYENKEQYVHNIWENTKSNSYVVYASEKDDKGFFNPRIFEIYEFSKDSSLSVKYEFDNYTYNTDKRLTLDDMYSYGISFGGRLFILCLENYLMTVPNKNGSSLFTIEKVENYAYVPTVMIGIGCVGSTTEPSSFEQLNLLTNRCYIELKRYNEIYDENIEVAYKISDYFDKNTKITILSINGVSFKGDSADVDGVGHFYYETISKDNTVIEDESEEGLYLWHVLKLEDGDTLDESVTDLKLELEINTEKVDIVQKMRFGVAYGSYGHRDRLFLTGNPEFPNMDIYSCETNDYENDWKDYTYFGDLSYAVVGTSETAIKGYGFLSDGSMAIIKESKGNTPNLFIRTSEMGKDEYENLIEMFPVKISGINIDSVLTNKFVNYGNDLLTITKDGIYKLMAGESTATQTYNAVEVSHYIRENLGKNIDDCAYAVYDNKLYISREDNVGVKRIYVADKNKYSYIDGKQVYEWFVLDGIEAEKMFVFNENLYFVCENVIKQFNDRYYDENYILIQDANINGEEFSSEAFVDAENNRIVLSSTNKVLKDIASSKNCLERWKHFRETTKIESNDWFCIERPNEKITFVAGGRCSVEFIDGVLDNFTFTILSALIMNCEPEYDSYGGVHYDHFPYVKNKYINRIELTEKGYNLYGGFNLSLGDTVVLQINPKKQNFKFDIGELYTVDGIPLSSCVSDDENIYYKNNDELIYLGKNDEVFFNSFSLKLFGYDIDFHFPDTNNVVRNVTIHFQEKVKSYWCSKFNSLGRLDYLKTIDRLTFVADGYNGGTTNVGYRTKMKETTTTTDFQYKHTLDFNDLDFNFFGFASTPFAETHTSKRKIKNFSFVQFIFESDNFECSTVVSMSVRYKYTKNNKGVR